MVAARAGVHPSSQPWHLLVYPITEAKLGWPRFIDLQPHRQLGSGGGGGSLKSAMVRIALHLGSQAWRPSLPTPSPRLAPHSPAGTLGLEEGQAPPKALLQELHVGGCRWVFEGGREAEDLFHVLRLHGGDVQEVVGVDVVDHSAIGQADHHLHGEAVLLQVQASQLLMGGVLLVVLQVLQLPHQGPGADEALVEEGKNGRTFQDGLPESPP